MCSITDTTKNDALFLSRSDNRSHALNIVPSCSFPSPFPNGLFSSFVDHFFHVGVIFKKCFELVQMEVSVLSEK